MKIDSVPSIFSVLFFFFFFFFFFLVSLSSLASSQSTDDCTSNLTLSARLPFNTTSLRCFRVWSSQDFVLRYEQSGPKLWNFILSAPDMGTYVAIGFSNNGKMVGTSAVAGWVSAAGSGTVKQYYLGGTRESQVQPDQGSLNLLNATIVSQSSRLYMAFMLGTDQPQSRPIYAVGPRNRLPSSDDLLSEHSDYVSTSFSYTTGQSSQKAPYSGLTQTHGVLSMLGWAIIMPTGAIIARYFRHLDPAWFYAHVSLQGLAFVLGTVGVIAGLSLKDKLSTNVDTHKALGIIILALGCLQVMAFLARPNKVSKVRKYWNWYHHNVGRLLIALAIGNVFYGISLVDGAISLNAGFGITIVVIFAVSIALEIRMCMKK